MHGNVTGCNSLMKTQGAYVPMADNSNSQATPRPFIDLAREGKNQWWRWLLGIAIVLVSWVGVGFTLGFLLVVWVMTDGNPDTYIDASTRLVKGMDPIVEYIVFNLGHVVLVVILFLVTRYVHRRRFLSLITPQARIDRQKVAWSFALWFALSCATTFVDYLLYPDAYELTFHPLRFLIFLPIALILTPIQTSGEELFFRGYLMQGLGLHTRNTWVLATIIGILFMAPHLYNPEVAKGMLPMALYYFGTGFFLAWVTLKSNSLEFALGIHAATCLSAALVANYKNSVMSTESIFYCNVLNPWNNLVYFGVMIVIFSAVMCRSPKQAALAPHVKSEPLESGPDSNI